MNRKKYLLVPLAVATVFSFSAFVPSPHNAKADVFVDDFVDSNQILPTILSAFDCYVMSLGYEEDITFSAPLFSQCAKYITDDYLYSVDTSVTEDIPGFSAGITSTFDNFYFDPEQPAKVLAENVETSIYLWTDGEYTTTEEIQFGISVKNQYVNWSHISDTLANVWLVIYGGGYALFDGYLSYYDVNLQEDVSYSSQSVLLGVPNDATGIQPLATNQVTGAFLQKMLEVPMHNDGYVFIKEFRISFTMQANGNGEESNLDAKFYLDRVSPETLDITNYHPDYNPNVEVSVSPPPTDVLFSPIKSFLTTEVFDGFTFGNLLTVMLGLALFGWFLRNFAGG